MEWYLLNMEEEQMDYRSVAQERMHRFLGFIRKYGQQQEKKVKDEGLKE